MGDGIPAPCLEEKPWYGCAMSSFFARTAIALVSGALLIGNRAAKAQINDLDLVLASGRVMDPETGLDAERNVGIRGDRIVEISSAPLRGKRVVDVSGLVVAPGFIDPHAHGQTNESHPFQARDGVTTALELESGRPFLRQWLEMKEGKTLIHYGATMAQGALRVMAMEKYRDVAREAREIVETEGFDRRGFAKCSGRVSRRATSRSPRRSSTRWANACRRSSPMEPSASAFPSATTPARAGKRSFGCTSSRRR